MRTAKQREEEFRADLKALLEKHKAELDITDDRRSYGMHKGDEVTEPKDPTEAADGQSQLTVGLERTREEFEAWWESKTNPMNSMHPCSTSRHEDERDGPVGEYVMYATWGAWEAWKEQLKRSNVKVTGLARPYRARSSDRRERGRP